MFGKSLGARRADVVRVQHFQRIGAGIAHEGTDVYNDERGDGQDAVQQHVPDIGEPGIAGAGIHHADGGDPPQLVHEHLDEEVRQKEGGQGNADHRKDRNAVIERAVLVRGGQNSQRNGDEELQDHRHQRDAEGNPHIVADDFRHGTLEFKRHTQIEPEQISKPGEIARNNSPERIVQKAVFFLDGVDVRLRHAPLRELRGKLVVYIVGRQQPHQYID